MNNFIPSNKATALYGQSKPCKKRADSFRNSSKNYDQILPGRVHNIQKKNYKKRKLAHNDSKHSEPKRLR